MRVVFNLLLFDAVDGGGYGAIAQPDADRYALAELRNPGDWLSLHGEQGGTTPEKTLGIMCGEFFPQESDLVPAAFHHAVHTAPQPLGAVIQQLQC